MIRKERTKGVSSYYRSISLNQVREDEGVYMIDLVESPYPEYNPHSYMELQQAKMDYQTILYNLNPMEQKIYQMRLQGFSYKEMAKALHINVKRVDNTVQKIKKKIKRVFD